MRWSPKCNSLSCLEEMSLKDLSFSIRSLSTSQIKIWNNILRTSSRYQFKRWESQQTSLLLSLALRFLIEALSKLVLSLAYAQDSLAIESRMIKSLTIIRSSALRFSLRRRSSPRMQSSAMTKSETCLRMRSWEGHAIFMNSDLKQSIKKHMLSLIEIPSTTSLMSLTIKWWSMWLTLAKITMTRVAGSYAEMGQDSRQCPWSTHCSHSSSLLQLLLRQIDLRCISQDWYVMTLWSIWLTSWLIKILISWWRSAACSTSLSAMRIISDRPTWRR